MVLRRDSELQRRDSEVLESETGDIGPGTQKLFDIIADESHTQPGGRVTEDSDPA